MALLIVLAGSLVCAQTGIGLKSSDDTYNIKIKTLEEKVNELKEKIFRSKARLILLQETVLHGVIAGARAVLTHKNDLGGNFLLDTVSYSLDGAPIFTKTDMDGELNLKKEIEIFNGSIVPGNHNVAISMTLKGGGFGLFSYLEGYKFRVRSSYTFSAEEGKVTKINIVGHEKGGVTTPLKDRPAIKYDVEVKKVKASKAKKN